MLRSLARWRMVAKARVCSRWWGGARLSSAAGEGRLAGKVALITGGASGLGLATAREFVRQGASVVVADLDSTLGPASVRELGRDAAFIRCDVVVERELAEAVDFTVSRHGRLDIMHNNAGIVGPSLPPSILELDVSQFDRVMSVNVRGTVLGIKHAARAMAPRGTGSILCTASISGLMGGLGPHQYTVSKFAVIGIVRSAASELRRVGVRVNCISPFPVATPMLLEQLAAHFPGVGKERLGEMVGRLGELEGARCGEADIANAAVYLASDEAKFVSGHNLVVDGGFTCYKNLKFPRPEDLPGI